MSDASNPDSSGAIRRVDQASVHRICSGQVVLSLSTALKELVENSLDAGAKAIEVKLRDMGQAQIEVSDDGHGIHPDHFQALTLKHHTSKIQAFADLTTVSTFGFRGEALSSLCALSQLEVSTRHASQALGTRLSFDAQGHLTGQHPLARNVGTTMALSQLFASIPVRRKAFERNIKREFARAVQILQAYCMISLRVRFMAVNVSGDQRKRTIACTSGHPVYKDNLIDLFGVRHFQSLLPIKSLTPSTESLAHFNVPQVGDEALGIRLTGFISSCAHGSGRSSADRQFFYVNDRPCDPSKVSKVVNDTYHLFNRHQYPFVFLNIQLPRESVDVNLTPDKRQLLLEREKYLLAVIQTSLKASFGRIPSELESLKTTAGPRIQDTSFLPVHSPVNEMVADLKAQFSGDAPSGPLKKRAKLESRVEDHLRVLDHPGKTIPSQSRLTGVELIPVLATPADIPAPRLQRETVVEDHGVRSRKSMSVAFCIGSCRTYTQDKGAKKREKREKREARFRRFLAKINPEDNSQAEKELRKNFEQTQFKRMQIYGQFNLGFIIAGLGEDLFIIDQHASDEKFNFERLQKANILESQNMVIPRPLPLSASDEGILLDHLEVFEQNGFEFDVDPKAEEHRVKLTRIPHYRNWVFGPGDVEELIFMLADAPSPMMCRPSRVHAMFASRACRTSIMIGTALSPNEMRRVVDHMGDMEQPWSCPHGRPTLRHLLNLNLIAPTVHGGPDE